ncbi:MAG: energy transducer TonB [bacterium]
MTINNKKKKGFVHLPKYPGGNSALKKFIKENLQYPIEAIKKRIEGSVFLSFQVNDDGEVFNVRIEKGIGYECDQEAVRIVSLLKYEKAKNKGLRVSIRMKIRIRFKLSSSYNKDPQVNYNYKDTTSTQANYSYSIKIQ